MKRLLILLALWLLPTAAFAQCNGVFPARTLCGNNTASPAIPGQFPASAITGVVAGTNGQIQYNNSGAFGGFTMSGDCTIDTSTGIITCNKTRTATADTSIAPTDCGGVVNAGTGSTGQFTITLPSTAGFSSTCQVGVYNADTTTLAGKKLSGFCPNLTSPNILFPGQFVALRVNPTTNAWTCTNPGRWRNPLGQIKWYINPGGSDLNDCLASGVSRACATPQAAATRALYWSDNQGSTPILNFACGVTHSGPLGLGGIPFGTQLVQISPDGNCSFDWFTGTASPALTVGDLAEVDLNLTFYGSSGGMRCQGNSTNATFSSGCLYFHGMGPVMDIEGAYTWFPSGGNDNGFFCDSFCQPIMANGMIQGAGGGDNMLYMSAGGKMTQSGTITGSTGAAINRVYRLFGNAMLIMGTANAAATTWTAGNPGNSLVSGNSTIVLNGLTPAGGIAYGTSAVHCTALTDTAC